MSKKVLFPYGKEKLSYEFDEDGYVTLMSWEGAENVGRLEFIY